ncbi:virulence RhuM family protein [sulfur-oxidizing endosymbiont of Gigantopelta aegis]|uniref:virulence RhuM family protein n=1 Tax=sulfur-oxidizing endosymbiont of Gigantopelta aegis TaxID=2794934 RepID=UPI0018DBC401|nr:virulence RhuM family protein [sulfur-oxidizing endosymbiont of Gigantopelta aegis]
MSRKKITSNPTNLFTEFILYTTPDNKVKVEIFLKDENIWLTQDKIAELFGVQRPAITKHLKNIFASSELVKDSVSSKMELTAQDGKNYKTNCYNLDAIISVGYRVNSIQATHFRIWATERLKEYIIKGFTMDDERLKNPERVFGEDYFEEQLERIRDIRSSERRFYQKITDIFAQCSVDYRKNTEETKRFFATVQNKLHWAITQQTAAEIVHERADSRKQNMGLNSWKNAPAGRVRKPDVWIAKNYLNKIELDELNRIVTMYLDYAEMQAKKMQVMSMHDWSKKLDAFLHFNEREILENAGKITAEVAKNFAELEFEKYRIVQDRSFKSDFDELLESQNKDKNK